MNSSDYWAGAIRPIWNAHRTTILRVAVALLSLYAALKLGTEFWRLLFGMSPSGAIDLHILQTQTRAWFEGHLVYAGGC